MNKCIICRKKLEYEEICNDCFETIISTKTYYFNNKHTFSEKHSINVYFELKKEAEKYPNTYDTDILNFARVSSLRAMYAISLYLFKNFNNTYLINRIIKDIKSLKVITKNNLYNEDLRNKWPKEHQCDDGHYVRSLSEMIIDNWLYNNSYIHAYEKSVYMKNNPDIIVLSDFYLPNQDVYIEFWGLENNEKYSKRKEEKIKLYKENNYNLIELTEKDIKRLNDIMPRLLGRFIK